MMPIRCVTAGGGVVVVGGAGSIHADPHSVFRVATCSSIGFEFYCAATW